MEHFDSKIHEECGVFGVYRRDPEQDVVATTYYGLYALQHRGQESCGMVFSTASSMLWLESRCRVMA